MEKLLTKNNSTSLKGMAAFFIMLGHIGINTAYPVLFPFRKAGFLWVGLFFFLSGYGLMYSHLNKPDYVKKAFLKRIIAVIVPTYLVYLIFQVIIWTILKTPAGYWTNIINRFVIYFVQDTNWFIPEILVFYVLFFILFRLFNSKIANVVLWIITIGFIIFAFIRRDIFSNPWYGSSLCFPLGITYALYEDKMQEFINNKSIHKLFIMAFIIVVCTVMFFVLGNDNVVGNLVARNIASMSFCFVALIVASLVNLDNAVMKILGEISFEIFLVHLQLLKILSSIEIGRVWVMILCILLTVVLSLILHKIFKLTKIAK